MEDKDRLIAELKAENERLKEENGKQRIEIYKQGQLYLKASDKAYNYKQVLQEIKAIAEQCVNKDTCYDCKYFNDCYIGDAKIPTYDICKLLIQKITKAESEDNR